MSSLDNQTNQQRATEDGPEYRSISMVQPLAAPIQRLAAPNMKRLSPLQRVNKSKPAFGLKISSSEDVFKTSSSSGSRWEVHDLPELPIDYTLVRTNVYVKESNAQVVADRICNALKSQSIVLDSKYFEEKNSIIGETQQGTKLGISLFAENGMTVVEVRRQAGCCMAFREAAKTILRSSKGLGSQQRSAPRKFNIPSTLPKRSMMDHQQCVRDEFRIAQSMLLSKKADSHLLALESMGKMTTKNEASDLAAKLVLSNCDCLKQMLFLLDLYTQDRSTSEMDHSILCRKILEILANSCEAIGKSDLEGILSTSDHDLKTRSFLSILLSSMDEAQSRPHDAYQAARCMRYLLVCEDVESTLIDMSAMDAISSARDVGCTLHKGLEQESFELMGQLQNVC